MELSNSSLRFCVAFSQPFSSLRNPFPQLGQNRIIRSGIRGLFVEFNFSAQQFVRVLVKAPRMAAANLKIAVRAIGPEFRRRHAVCDFSEIGRPAYWIGNRGEKDVRSSALDVMDGGFDILHLLAFITPHEKHAGLDTSVFTNVHSV